MFQVVFFMGKRFMSENTLRHSRSTLGDDISFCNHDLNKQEGRIGQEIPTVLSCCERRVAIPLPARGSRTRFLRFGH